MSEQNTENDTSNNGNESASKPSDPIRINGYRVEPDISSPGEEIYRVHSQDKYLFKIKRLQNNSTVWINSEDSRYFHSNFQLDDNYQEYLTYPDLRQAIELYERILFNISMRLIRDGITST